MSLEKKTDEVLGVPSAGAYMAGFALSVSIFFTNFAVNYGLARLEFSNKKDACDKVTLASRILFESRDDAFPLWLMNYGKRYAAKQVIVDALYDCNQHPGKFIVENR